MDSRLFPYQQKAVDWIKTRRSALLALEMGLGKTIIALRAAFSIPTLPRGILVVCPAIAVQNWLREIETWWPEGALTVNVVSYNMVHKIPRSSRWSLAILDESHYLKSIEAKRTKSILGKSGLLHRCERAWFLSGTPMPNHVGELWPMLYSCGRTALPYREFIERYCNLRLVSGKYEQIVGTKLEMAQEIREKFLSPEWCLWWSKSDVGLELPPMTWETIHLADPGLSVLKDEESSREEVMIVLKKEAEAARIALQAGANLSTIARSVSTLRRITGLKKIAPVVELVEEELASGAYKKIIIFAVHQQVVEGIQNGLAAFGAVSLYGKTQEGNRQVSIDRFQTDPKCRVLVANIATAGTSITLTAAHHVLFCEQDWVPGNNHQAASRAHRIGQEFPVSVRVAVIDDFIDDRIGKILIRKQRELSAIRDRTAS